MPTLAPKSTEWLAYQNTIRQNVLALEQLKAGYRHQAADTLEAIVAEYGTDDTQVENAQGRAQAVLEGQTEADVGQEDGDGNR